MIPLFCLFCLLILFRCPFFHELFVLRSLLSFLQCTPHIVRLFLVFLLLFLSVGSGGGFSRSGGCGSGAHGGGSVGASHGGRVPRTFSIVKSLIMRCTQLVSIILHPLITWWPRPSAHPFGCSRDCSRCIITILHCAYYDIYSFIDGSTLSE